MNEHREWQKRVSLSHFKAAPVTIPRQVRLAAAAAYSGASITDTDAWIKGAGL